MPDQSSPYKMPWEVPQEKPSPLVPELAKQPSKFNSIPPSENTKGKTGGLFIRIIFSLAIFVALIFSGVGILVYDPSSSPEQSVWLTVNSISLILFIIFLASLPLTTYFRLPSKALFFVGVLLFIAVIGSLFMRVYIAKNLEESKFQLAVKELSEEFRIFAPTLSSDWKETNKSATNDGILVLTYKKSDKILSIGERKEPQEISCSLFYGLFLRRDLVKKCEPITVNNVSALYSFRDDRYRADYLIWAKDGTMIYVKGSGMTKQELIEIAKSFQTKDF